MLVHTDSITRALVVTLALCPIVTFSLAYLTAVILGHLPACIPFVTGCTTTSATGHAWPERAIFLTGMLSTAGLCGWFWHRCAKDVATGMPGKAGALKLLGTVTAISLAGYALCIGQPGDTMRLLRRIGINGYYLSNYAAQVVFLLIIVRRERRTPRGLLTLCLALPALVVAAEMAKAYGLPRRPTNNVLAWNGVILVCAYYAAAGMYLTRRSAEAARSLRR